MNDCEAEGCPVSNFYFPCTRGRAPVSHSVRQSTLRGTGTWSISSDLVSGAAIDISIHFGRSGILLSAIAKAGQHFRQSGFYHLELSSPALALEFRSLLTERRARSIVAGPISQPGTPGYCRDAGTGDFPASCSSLSGVLVSAQEESGLEKPRPFGKPGQRRTGGDSEYHLQTLLLGSSR